MKYDIHFLIFVFKNGSHYPHVSLAYWKKKSKLYMSMTIFPFSRKEKNISRGSQYFVCATFIQK